MAAPNLVFALQVAFQVLAANPASLGAFDASKLEEGATGWTAAQRADWKLAKNAPAGTVADGITIVAATNAGASAFWMRQTTEDLYWGYQTGWTVDSVTGSDNNIGSTAANLPLLTMAELCRRVRLCTTGATFVVQVPNTIPTTDLFNPQLRLNAGGTGVATVYGVTMQLVGVRTVVRSGTTGAGTQQTSPIAAAATAQAEIADPGTAWTADVGRLVVAANGDTAWVLTDKAGGVGTAARVSDWMTTAGTFSAAGPGVGVAYNVVTLTQFRAPVQQNAWLMPNNSPGLGGFAIVAQDLDFDDLGNAFQPLAGLMAIRFFTSRLSNSNGGTNYTFMGGLIVGSFLDFAGCLFDNTNVNGVQGLTFGNSGRARITMRRCGVRRTIVQMANIGQGSFITGLCIQGGWIQGGVTAGLASPDLIIGGAANGGWLGIYNDFYLPAGITSALLFNKILTRISIEGSVYGVGEVNTAIGGLTVNGGCRVSIKNTIIEAGGGGVTATTCWNLQPSGAGVQLSLDGAATLMPGLNASAGAVLPAAAAYLTFAQYRAAPFSRTVQNWTTGSAMLTAA